MAPLNPFAPLYIPVAAVPFFSFPRNVITYIQIHQHPNYNYHNSYPRPHLDNIIPFKHEQELSGCYYDNYNMSRGLPPMPMYLPSIQMHSEEPYYTSAPPLSEEMPCIIKEVVKEEEQQQEKVMKINCPDHYMVKRAIIKPSFINKWKSKRSCCRRKTQRNKKIVNHDDQQHHLQQQQEEEYSVSASLFSRTTTITTLMIRNIPNKFDKKKVLDMLDDHCRMVNEKIQATSHDQGGDHADALSEFDFLYLPMDFGTGCNCGYAFVNFTTPAAAQRLYTDLDHKSWGITSSRKICEVTKARIQGLAALLRHFRGSTFICENGDYRPIHFVPSRNGMRLTNQQYIGRHIFPWDAAADS